MDLKPVDILLVEDNPNDIELTKRALNKSKIINSVVVVEDGQDALDYIFCEGKFSDLNKLNKPKLILLDLKLPKISGLDVLEKIKSDKYTRGIPVVVLTSSAEEKDIIDSYNLGVNSYIVKPVEFSKFSECIENLGLYWMLLNKAPE